MRWCPSRPHRAELDGLRALIWNVSVRTIHQEGPPRRRCFRPRRGALGGFNPRARFHSGGWGGRPGHQATRPGQARLVCRAGGQAGWRCVGSDIQGRLCLHRWGLAITQGGHCECGCIIIAFTQPCLWPPARQPKPKQPAKAASSQQPAASSQQPTAAASSSSQQ